MKRTLLQPSNTPLNARFDAYQEPSSNPNYYAYAENEVVEFNMLNSWQPGGWGPKLSIDGYAPDGPGPFPVYVWLPGTGSSHWTDVDKAHAMDMARRGFVAASVDYPNQNYPRMCLDFIYKARDVFLGSETWSAISVICAEAKADCGKGIAVSGFSQGANIANLAHNFHPGVRAIYLIGNVESNVDHCWDKTDTSINRSRILSVMGENDRNKDAEYALVAASLESTTGYLRGDGLDCAEEARDCIQSDGSGWYIVQPTETASGRAGHCFQYEGDACWRSTLDENYYPDDNTKWGMKKSHEWLSSSSFYGSSTPEPLTEPSISNGKGCGVNTRKEVCTADGTNNCRWSHGACVPIE